MAITAILLIITGIGVGPNFNSPLIPIHASFDENSPASDISLSASSYAFIRAIGSSLGISIGGLVCFEELSHLELSETGHLSVTQAISAAQKLSGSQRQVMIDVFQKAMNHVFLTSAVVMGAGFLMSLMVRKHTLGDKVRSNQRVGTKKLPVKEEQVV